MKNPEPLTLLNCDQEPIHIPGAIQPFAWLFVLDENKIIRAISANFLQAQPLLKSAVLNQPFNDLTLFSNINLQDANSLNQTQSMYIAETRYSVHINPLANKPAWLTVEIEPFTDSYSSSRDPQSQAHNIVSSLLTCNDRQTLFSTLLSALQDYIGYDRCMVYQFDDNWNGSVVAEAKTVNLEPFLG